jgi:hypothetical protein
MNISKVLREARIVVPGPLLTMRYALHCECGLYKDCGYSPMTAQRFADLHSSRFGHDVTIFEWEGEPQPRVSLIKRFRLSNGLPCGTIVIGTRTDREPKSEKGSSNGTKEGFDPNRQDPSASEPREADDRHHAAREHGAHAGDEGRPGRAATSLRQDR